MENKSDQARGVSDRNKRLEAELKLSNAKLKVLLENVSSGVAVYEARNNGEDFVFKDFNRAAEEVEQIRKEQLIGRSVAEVFPGVKDFGLFDVFQRVWRTGTPEHHPVSVYKDQRISGWRENYVFKLPSGEIMVVYDDVTKHKHSELAIRMSEQCFRAIADYTYSWEVWVNPEGRVMWTNPAVERVAAYTVKELMAMQDYPVPFIHQQDRERMRRAFQSALKGTSGKDVQFRIVRKDDRVIHAAMSWQPIYDEKGVCLGHRESIRDVTVQKQAEDALQRAEQEKERILDSLTELVVYEDRDLVILWANRAACESVAMTREQLIGRYCYEFWGDGKGLCPGCPVLKAIATGRTHEHERWSADGRAWLVHGSPARNEQGDIVGAVDIALDITARKRAEEALQKSEQNYRRLAEGSA
ncbi:MAG TPA: PAS domain-containing protein [Sedimentisphaerales bacterium]|nr:PAS domain-containing protein [Sedimentisphaerales bacterium]